LGETVQIHLLTRTAAIAITLILSSLAQAAEPYWPDHLTIGTASPGGTYFVYGAGLRSGLRERFSLDERRKLRFLPNGLTPPIL
jgi:TRAP-type uncharacterized transport system substrate-binding protein